jgi:hypothetical protein
MTNNLMGTTRNDFSARTMKLSGAGAGYLVYPIGHVASAFDAARELPEEFRHSDPGPEMQSSWPMVEIPRRTTALSGCE